MSKNDEEFKNLYENYHELFEKIDNLIDQRTLSYKKIIKNKKLTNNTGINQ